MSELKWLYHSSHAKCKLLDTDLKKEVHSPSEENDMTTSTLTSDRMNEKRQLNCFFWWCNSLIRFDAAESTDAKPENDAVPIIALPSDKTKVEGSLATTSKLLKNSSKKTKFLCLRCAIFISVRRWFEVGQFVEVPNVMFAGLTLCWHGLPGTTTHQSFLSVFCWLVDESAI